MKNILTLLIICVSTILVGCVNGDFTLDIDKIGNETISVKLLTNDYLGNNIIQEDLLKIKEKYTELVFGTLVIQDIVGIFMMVILSTISARQNISGVEIMGSLLLMVLYLIIWLVFGIYLLPTFFNKTIKLMNDEMLLVVSIGICFGMVLLADNLGFSTALGSFLAG